MTWSRSGRRLVPAGYRHKDVRGERTVQFGPAGVRLLGRPRAHTVVARHEYHLASGLYPGAPEFKHQDKIALDMLANSPDDDSRGVPGGDLRHCLARLAQGRMRLLGGRVREPELGQAGDEVAVRAANRVAEQLDQAAFHILRDHVLPAARLDVNLLPRQLDDPD